MTDLADRLAGRFLVLDGHDGAGKSTQLALLARRLGQDGVVVTETRDPGGTVIGENIRRILLDRSHAEMTVATEMLLYMASRAQLMGQVIQPALESGQCVLCDRWVSATVAYQVAEGKATADQVLQLYRLALKDAEADLTIILDIDPQVGLGRLGREGAQPDRMEAKGEAFHRQVRKLFLRQARGRPRRFVVVDASNSVQEVHRQIVDIVRTRRLDREDD